MQTPEIKPFKDHLLQMRAGLLTQIAQQRGELARPSDASSEHFGHPDEAGARMASERELLLALGERESAELGAIDAALARIAAGGYGECTDCGTTIAPARLHASPEAPRCIHCQEKMEQHHA
jgi:DnaK suppressor protein